MTIRTVTALFDSRSSAEQARARLVQLGIPEASIELMDQSTGRLGSAETRNEGFWAKLKHFFLPEEDRYTYEEGLRRGGCLVAASVEEVYEPEVISTMEDCGATDLEQRQAEWRKTGWTGSTAQQGEQVIPVAEERVRIGKRQIDRGSVRVRSYAVEQPVEESVQLGEERVEVERPFVTPLAQQSLHRLRFWKGPFAVQDFIARAIESHHVVPTRHDREAVGDPAAATGRSTESSRVKPDPRLAEEAGERRTPRYL